MKGSSKQMIKHQLEYEAKCTFKPVINKLSAKIVEEKIKELDANEDGLRDSMGKLEAQDSVYERLYGLSLVANSSKPEEFKATFKPDINENTEQIISMMRSGDDY